MSGNMNLMRSASLRNMHAAGAAQEQIGHAVCVLRSIALSCGGCVLIYAAVMCGIYWGWLSKSTNFDDNTPNWTIDTSPFDTCGGLTEASTATDGSISTEFINTKWSVLLAFNSYLYLIHCILTFLVLLGTTGILWPCCVCGGCGHCFSGCAHLALVIVTGVFRFSDEGERCASNKGLLDTDGTTFEDMGD